MPASEGPEGPGLAGRLSGGLGGTAWQDPLVPLTCKGQNPAAILGAFFVDALLATSTSRGEAGEAGEASEAGE